MLISKILNMLKKFFINNGFEIDLNQDCVYHLVFKYNGITIELHYRLFDDGVNKNWIKFFKNPFDYCLRKDKYMYVLDDTIHFIYCLCHFAHHLRKDAGLRYCLDFYYMLKKQKLILLNYIIL